MSVPSMRIAVVTCFALVAAACSQKPATDTSTARTDTATTPPKPAVVDSATASAPALRGTDWKLVALGDKAVAFPDTQHVAHIVLQPDAKVVAGSGGCNRMFGVYELKDDALRFSGVGSTKMACKGLMETESAFLAALLKVAKWKVNGRQLQLSDAAGVLLATLEPR